MFVHPRVQMARMPTEHGTWPLIRAELAFLVHKGSWEVDSFSRKL